MSDILNLFNQFTASYKAVEIAFLGGLLDMLRPVSEIYGLEIDMDASLEHYRVHDKLKLGIDKLKLGICKETPVFVELSYKRMLACRFYVHECPRIHHYLTGSGLGSWTGLSPTREIVYNVSDVRNLIPGDLCEAVAKLVEKHLKVEKAWNTRSSRELARLEAVYARRNPDRNLHDTTHP